jgi:hypothetical protein
MTDIPPANARWYYADANNQPVGPLTTDALQSLLQGGTISLDTLVIQEGGTEWQPLRTIISLTPPAAPPAPQPQKEVVQTNVKQGALIGGLACFALGIWLMHVSLWSFFFYGPLFLVSFILSIVAMSQRRIVGGIILLLATLVVPAVLGLYSFSSGLADGLANLDAKTHPAPAASPLITKQPDLPPPDPLPAADTGIASKSAPTATPTPEPPKPKYPELEEKNGFRGARLGAPFSQFARVHLRETSSDNAGNRSFVVEDIDKKIGNAEFDILALDFSQGILKEIRVRTTGKENALGLRAALIAAYGNPKPEKHFMSDDDLVWEGPTVKLLLCFTITGDAVATFTNKDVDAKIESLIQQKAKEGATSGAKNL